MKKLFIGLAIILVLNIQAQNIIVLGTAQDGGFPHIGCTAECQGVYKYPSMERYVTSLAIVDEEAKKWWLLDATPDLDDQLRLFQELTNKKYPYLPDGIFLTHAHMGHYSGLMLLGREALGAKNANVYAMPRMKKFLEENGPWSQLVELKNIVITELAADESKMINENIAITPFLVPHRDEFSETVGYHISLYGQTSLFIPDIDKWSNWERNIVEEVKKVDHAFLDASFYADGELPNRSMAEIPHPFVVETMKLFQNESEEVKAKIKFIHFNHTNPVLFSYDARKKAKEKGFTMAEQGDIY